MSINVKLDAKLKRSLRQLNDADSKKTMFILGNEVARLSHRFVPYMDGDLRKSVFVEAKKSSAKIYYNEPYATNIYFGVNFAFNTAGTRAKWTEPVTKNKRLMEKIASSAVRKVVKIL